MGATHYNSVLTTTDQAVFTPTSADAILRTVLAVNSTASAATVNLSVSRSAGTETLASAVSVPANSTVQLVDGRLQALGGVVVHANAEAVHASAGTASAITLLLAE
jgi:hypothetical protein